MAKDYDALAKAVVENIGGPENIISVTHCITRLRFKLKDESIAKTDVVKKIKGVVSVVQAGGQYQVVIGSDVDDAYQAVGRIPGISLEGALDIKEAGIAAFISGIFGTISEPAIYGVNLKYKRPFICASIFTGIGGAIIAAAGADCIMQLGSISIYTMAMFVTLLPGGVGILIGVLVGFFGSAISSYITFNDSMIEE